MHTRITDSSLLEGRSEQEVKGNAEYGSDETVSAIPLNVAGTCERLQEKRG